MNFTKKHVLGMSVAARAGARRQRGLRRQTGETVKIAWIDPLSGPFANIGQNSLKTFQFVAEKVSASNPAGVKFEIVSFDNKARPQESLTRAQGRASTRASATSRRATARARPARSSTRSTSTTSATPARRWCTSTTPRSTPT